MLLFAAMKKITFILLITLISCSFSSLKAQNISSNYRTAVGVKMYPGSISFKQGLDDSRYLEALGAFWNKGFRTTLLYEIHNPLFNAAGLRWYYGAGAHVGFYNSKYYKGSSLIGIDGVLGIDYKVQGAPLNLSIDWQPSFEFGDGSGFEGWGGIGVRFTF
jgi:hypothetical protein